MRIRIVRYPTLAATGAAILLSVSGCGKPDADPAADPDAGAVARRSVEAPVIGREGEVIGSVLVEQLDGDGVRVSLHVEGLEPGPRAVHFHEHPRCDAPDFESAGGHFNPAGARHGEPRLGEVQTQDHHAGDMPNQLVDAQGVMHQTLENGSVNLDRGASRLLDGGAALAVHAQADDYETQPSGAAGPRVACAVIR